MGQERLVVRDRDGERLLLFDPLGVPSEIEALAAERETAIVLTAPWHERDAESLVERLGVPVYTPLPDTAQYLMDTYGLTAEQAGDGSPDVVWLLREGKGRHTRTRRRPAAVRRRRPPGPQAERHRALGRESRRGDLRRHARRLRPRPRDQREMAAARRDTRDVAAGLRALLQLPVEHVLATHGGPYEALDLEDARCPLPRRRGHFRTLAASADAWITVTRFLLSARGINTSFV